MFQNPLFRLGTSDMKVELDKKSLSGSDIKAGMSSVAGKACTAIGALRSSSARAMATPWPATAAVPWPITRTRRTPSTRATIVASVAAPYSVSPSTSSPALVRRAARSLGDASSSATSCSKRPASPWRAPPPRRSSAAALWRR